MWAVQDSSAQAGVQVVQMTAQEASHFVLETMVAEHTPPMEQTEELKPLENVDTNAGDEEQAKHQEALALKSCTWHHRNETVC